MQRQSTDEISIVEKCTEIILVFHERFIGVFQHMKPIRGIQGVIQEWQASAQILSDYPRRDRGRVEIDKSRVERQTASDVEETRRRGTSGRLRNHLCLRGKQEELTLAHQLAF